MPVDHYFLFLAVEDVENHVFWGAHIAHLPSWQMKIYRRYENLAVRGGLADLKFGNWKKNVAPGERFHTSEAILPIALHQTARRPLLAARGIGRVRGGREPRL